MERGEPVIKRKGRDRENREGKKTGMEERKVREGGEEVCSGNFQLF